MIEDIIKDARVRMGKSVVSLGQEFDRIRTGRAHTGLLDHISAEYYGSEVPLSQIANISVEDSRTLSVTPWEKGMVSVVEKAIIDSDLGLNPVSAGSVIRIPLPPLTEQRRKELVKVVKHEAENCKVAIRNIRRDANHELKLLLKEKDISEDEERHGEGNVQKQTDEHIQQVESTLADKEKELMEF
jgi:ribosome recycling factor